MRMGRKRKHRKDLPERVYFNHGAYYFVAKDGEWIWLGKDHGAAMRRYADFCASPIPGRVSAIMDRYIKDVLPEKAPRTRAGNTRELVPLRKVFGHMEPQDITPQDLYAYRDSRPKIAANRELALFSAILSKAIEWGALAANPCRQVRRNKETPRRRHVEQAEYEAVYAMAPAVLQCAMELARQTALRVSDLLSLNERENVREEGIYIETGKTGKRLLFRWTRELRAVVDRARGLRGKVRSTYIVSNQSGQRYTLSGFETLWQRLIKKAVQEGKIKERFRFNDLRAMAADLSDNATELLGHDDPRTTNRIYRRAPRKVTPNR